MNKDIFAKYAATKRVIKEMEAIIDELAPQVLAEMVSLQADEVTSDDGKFTIGARKKWTYSEEITMLDETLKAKKKEAEQKGLATYVETPFITLTLKKDEQKSENL